MSNKIEIELRGPEFIQSAVEITQRISVNTLTNIFVYNMTADCVKSLEGALQKLRAYFVKGGAVIITTSQILPKSAKAVLQGASGVMVQISHSMLSMPSSDLSQPDSPAANGTITGQMQTDAAAQKSERWKIMQKTQTNIFEITQDITVNKIKTAEKQNKVFSGYIRS